MEGKDEKKGREREQEGAVRGGKGRPQIFWPIIAPDDKNRMPPFEVSPTILSRITGQNKISN